MELSCTSAGLNGCVLSKPPCNFCGILEPHLLPPPISLVQHCGGARQQEPQASKTSKTKRTASRCSWESTRGANCLAFFKASDAPRVEGLRASHVHNEAHVQTQGEWWSSTSLAWLVIHNKVFISVARLGANQNNALQKGNMRTHQNKKKESTTLARRICASPTFPSQTRLLRQLGS